MTTLPPVKIIDSQDAARRTVDILQVSHPEIANPTDSGFVGLLSKWIGRPINTIKGWFLADSKELYGKFYVSKELKDHAKLTATAISIASIINSVTNQPILVFAFRDMGNAWAVAISVGLNILMIKFTNEMGTIAAGGSFGKRRFWSFAGTLGMIGMGLLQSVPAVVGSEALGNGPGLATIKAEELLDLQKQRVTSMQPQRDIQLEEYQKEFNNLKQQQDKLPYDTDGLWNSLQVQLNGEYKDQGRDWSGDQLEQLPLAKKIERLQARQNQEIQKAQKDWEQRESRRQAINNDVEFLAKELPELFKQHFNAEDYSLRSGTEIIRLATVNVWNKASKGDWAGLGFPVFFLALSLITSAAASVLTIAHAGREDVEVSRDPRVGEAIEQYLDDLVKATQDDDYPY